MVALGLVAAIGLIIVGINTMYTGTIENKLTLGVTLVLAVTLTVKGINGLLIRKQIKDNLNKLEK